MESWNHGVAWKGHKDPLGSLIPSHGKEHVQNCLLTLMEWQWVLGALARAPGDQVRIAMGLFWLLLDVVFSFQDVPLIDVFTVAC